MKKTAFVFGYAGSIAALIFAMLMLFTVPLRLSTEMLDNVHDDLESQHVLAFNEMMLTAQKEGLTDFSEESLMKLGERTAEGNKTVSDKQVYVETARFVYKTGIKAIISLIVVGAAIILSLVALIGALMVKKASNAGGVMMLIAAFFLLLASIYTGTISPMFIASALLTIAGIAVFIPGRMDRTGYVQPYAARPYPQQSYAQPPCTQPYNNNAGQYTNNPPMYEPPAAYAPVYTPPQEIPPAATSENAESEENPEVPPSSMTFPDQTVTPPEDK